MDFKIISIFEILTTSNTCDDEIILNSSSNHINAFQCQWNKSYSLRH